MQTTCKCCAQLEEQVEDSMQATQTFVEQHVASALAKMKTIDNLQCNAHKVLRSQLDEKLQGLSRIMQTRLEDVQKDACERAR
jgi:hypothetical protein